VEAQKMIKHVILSGGLSTAIIVFTLPLGAAVTGRTTERPDAASYREASAIFQAVNSDAEQALNNAATLQSFESADSPSWVSHADLLNQLRAEVNNMGQDVSRLETIRGVVAPWQQNVVDRIAANLQLMADNTRDAIAFGNSNPHDLLNLTYQNYVNNLYDEASAMKLASGNAVKYAKVLKEYRGLRKGIDLKAS
jgi:hypothetical protein